MTVRVYRSTDGSAPTMARSIGAMITFLDAILVNGYGAKTAAGWTKSFSGTNKAVYRAGGGTQAYLRVDDSTQANYSANVAGGTGASDVDTLTGRFPTEGSTANVFDKTSNNNWIVIANNKAFYMFMGGDLTLWSAPYNNPNVFNAFFFGDITAHSSSDTGRALLGCGSGTGIQNPTVGNMSGAPCAIQMSASNVFSAAYPTSEAYMALDANLRSPAPRARLECLGVNNSATSYYQNVHPFLGFDIRRIEVFSHVDYRPEVIVSRGFMPGIYLPRSMQGFGWKGGQTWSGTGADSGKTFELINTVSTMWTAAMGGIAGVMPLIVETSDTWDN